MKIKNRKKSGVKGIVWNKQSKKWVVFSYITGKRKYVGSCKTIEDSLEMLNENNFVKAKVSLNIDDSGAIAECKEELSQYDKEKKELDKAIFNNILAINSSFSSGYLYTPDSEKLVNLGRVLSCLTDLRRSMY